MNKNIYPDDTQSIESETARRLPSNASDLKHVLIIPYYMCDKQLSFAELKQLIQQHQYYPRAKEEVQELIKNDIIRKAYTKGDELRLYIQDSPEHISRYKPTPKINYASPVALDYSDPVTISAKASSFEDTIIYPHTVLAYNIIGDFHITQYLRDGTQVQIWGPKDLIKACKVVMKKHKVMYLPIKEQAFRKYENILIEQGVQVPLKNTIKYKK